MKQMNEKTINIIKINTILIEEKTDIWLKWKEEKK